MMKNELSPIWEKIVPYISTRSKTKIEIFTDKSEMVGKMIIFSLYAIALW